MALHAIVCLVILVSLPFIAVARGAKALIRFFNRRSR